ncbi:hypothetical protein E4U14_007758 [Claviceps sp. LM454 group G7]|nr:hypothetical protein E4U14_007758 [Claviceps sp. LM454 group G7]
MTKTEIFVQDPYRAQTEAPPHPVQVMTPIHPTIKAHFFTTEIYRGTLFAIANVHRDDGTPPPTDALNGTFIVTGLFEQIKPDDKEICLFSWVELSFTTPGTFSLLIDVFEATSTEATLLGQVLTRKFTVMKEAVTGEPIGPTVK